MGDKDKLFKLICQFDSWLKVRTEAQRHLDRLQEELRNVEAESKTERAA